MAKKQVLPAWQQPETCLTLLAAAPPERRNRVLYELLWCFEGENVEATNYSVLRSLLQDSRFQGLQNVRYWLTEVMLGDYELSVLWDDIRSVIDNLHPETCGIFGDYVHNGATAAQLTAIMDWLLQHGSGNARYAAYACLLRLPPEELSRRPDWQTWLAAEIQRIQAGRKAGHER